MERTETKDSQGNIISVSTTYSEEEVAQQNQGIGVLVLLGGVATAVYYFFEIISNPEALSYPYYFFAKYYQLVLYYPYQFIASIFQILWGASLSLTQYENLNLSIACIAVAIIGFLLLKLLHFIFSKLAPFIYYILLGPGVIWIVFWLGNILLNWLLKT